MNDFDFEEERIKKEIIRVAAKRVLLQLPEGLKPEAPNLAQAIMQANALPIISADPCYGACDIAISEAESLGVDLIVHVGHAEFVRQARVPTIYVEAKAKVSVDKVVRQALPLLTDYKKIGIATSVQHLQELNRINEILIESGKTVLIGNFGQLAYAGQVIGCNYSNVVSIAPEVEAFLFVGGGLFHGLGVALSTSKPTVIADPYDNKAFSVSEEAKKILSQRWAGIQEAKGAKAFGIFVGLKPGQRRFEQALYVKDLAEKHGRAAYLFAAREITPELILEFPSLDAYVNTACPRVSLEAPKKFSKPMLTVNEFMVVVGDISWENMLKKGLFGN